VQVAAPAAARERTCTINVQVAAPAAARERTCTINVQVAAPAAAYERTCTINVQVAAPAPIESALLNIELKKVNYMSTRLDKVLIVDDEPYVLEGLRIMVDWEKHGFEICGEATNGEEAYELIKSLSPDVVITDIQMPYLNGLELIRRTIGELMAIPKFIILSGYTDFQYVQTAIRYKVIQYMSKPIIVEEVDEVLVKLRQELDHDRQHRSLEHRIRRTASAHAVSKWICGESYETMPIGIAEWLGVYEQSSFMIVLAELEQLELGGTASFIAKSKIEQIGDQLVTSLSAFNRCVSFNDSEGRIGILAIEPIWSHAILENQLHLLSDWVKATWKLNISFYISCTDHGVHQLNTLYKQALQASIHRMAECHAGVFLYIPPNKDPMLSVRLNIHITSLIELIKQGDSKGIIGKVDEIFIHMVNNHVTQSEISIYYATIHAQLIELMLQWDRTLESDLSRLFMSMEYQGVKPVHLKQHLIDLCQETIRLIAQLKHETYGHSALYELIEYVRLHYNEKLKLQVLAAQFQWNPIYLGQLFKKRMGTPFNDYIHLLRIEESKKLLRRTDMKIAEIAKCIGYPSSEYFVGIFKAREKCLPSSFRKSNV
jgi:two-component system response regulator YesN